jgi:glycosyltransferase involved in cell wall biosynthesis
MAMTAFPGLELETGSPRRGPLRVCLVCMQFAGPTHCGGVGTAFFSLAEALAERGHDVHVVLARDDIDRGASADWRRRLRAKGIDFVHLPRTHHRGSQFDGRTEPSLNCYRWLKGRAFDVIHFHEWLGLGYHTILAKRQGGAFQSTVLCVGTHGPELWAREGNGVLWSAAGQLETQAMERETVRLADVVVSPSRYMLEWLERRGWSLPRRTYVHPNVLWSKAVSKAPAVGATRLVSELVFFGRLEPRKGLYRFCDAVERLARNRRGALSVTFLGRNRWLEESGRWADDLIRRRSAAWPCPASILTDRNHEEALDYLKGPGRLAVVASRRENSPYTVLECLGAGIPLVSADVGGVRELIHPEDRARVLFAEEELAQKLERVLADGASPARPAADLGWVRDTWIRWHEQQPAAFARARASAEPRGARALSEP